MICAGFLWDDAGLLTISFEISTGQLVFVHLRHFMSHDTITELRDESRESLKDMTNACAFRVGL